MTTCKVCSDIEIKQTVATPDAVAELALKVTLERRFRPEMARMFGVIVRDYRASVATLGVLPPNDLHVGPIESVLDNHYRRVQREFSGRVRRVAQRVKQDDDPRLTELIALALLTWRNTVSTRRAREIVATNRSQMEQALEQARANVAARGDPLDNPVIAREAAVLLRARFNARLTTIATSETNEPAEATKQVEAEALGGMVPFILRGRGVIMPETEPRDVQKRWQTVGDAKVRPSHVRVGGTILPVDGVFTVGQSRLRFPSDALLGAQVSETVNCRCSSVYEFETPS